MTTRPSGAPYAEESTTRRGAGGESECYKRFPASRPYAGLTALATRPLVTGPVTAAPRA